MLCVLVNLFPLYPLKAHLKISAEIVGSSKTKKISRNKAKPGSIKLHLSKLEILGMPQVGSAINLEVRTNEVVGIAGVNGQSELVEAIIGLRSSKSGSIEICNFGKKED